MGKDKSKDRDARRAGKFVKRKNGMIPELEGYYFSHVEKEELVPGSTRWCRILPIMQG